MNDYNYSLVMDNSLPSDKRQTLKTKIITSKKAIDALLKQYKYQEDCSHSENMKKLCSCLENVMNVQSLYDFHKFLSNQEQLPIQVNFKALKYEKLVQMFQDWLVSKDEHNVNAMDRAITHKHRNILFKRIIIEENDTIREYFETLSEKKKLKGFDLFQLLTELLGAYFLYEFNIDNQTFFDKVNSFETFTKIVESYIKNGVRSYTKDRNDPNDELYIRFHEIQALIQFWELVNPELTLQQYPRKNMVDSSIQTILVNSANAEVQTQKQNSKSLLSIINRSLHEINNLIEIQNDPSMLQSLDKILDVLRSEKIFVVTYNSQKNDKKIIRNPMRSTILSQYSQAQPLFANDQTKIRLTSPNKGRSPNKVLGNPNEKEEDDLKIIFRSLCAQDNLHCLTSENLQGFFCDLGIINQRQTFLINKLISYGYIQDKDDINLKQFKSIMRQITKQDRRINSSLFKSYITSQIEHNSIRKTAYFKTNQTANRSSNLLNQSLLNRDRTFREESRTTFPMDSDGGSNA